MACEEATIFHYSTYPAGGGAGIAAERLVRGLRGEGLHAELLGVSPRMEAPYLGSIQYGKSLQERIWRRWRRRQLRGLPPGYEGMSADGAVFHSDRSAHGWALRRSFRHAGLLHFHWMSDLIDYETSLAGIPEGVPLVWTLHDMSPFTGGCSYSLGCRGFEGNCRTCPQLPAAAAPEAERSLRRKVAAADLIGGRMACVAPSRWLTGEARRSRVFAGVRCETIPNGLDLATFSPWRREAFRAEHGLGGEDRYLLFVAASLTNPLKGMDTLLEAVGDLGARKGVRVAYLGKAEAAAFPDEWEGLGNLREESDLAKVYAAADLVVVPSRADNYPNVISEALACGTPVAASRIGGIPEQVREGETGWLVEPGDAEDLRRTLDGFLSLGEAEYLEYRRRARRFAEKTIELGMISQQYRKLYEELLENAAGIVKKGRAS